MQTSSPYHDTKSKTFNTLFSPSASPAHTFHNTSKSTNTTSTAPWKLIRIEGENGQKCKYRLVPSDNTEESSAVSKDSYPHIPLTKVTPSPVVETTTEEDTITDNGIKIPPAESPSSVEPKEEIPSDQQKTAPKEEKKNDSNTLIKRIIHKINQNAESKLSILPLENTQKTENTSVTTTKIDKSYSTINVDFRGFIRENTKMHNHTFFFGNAPFWSEAYMCTYTNRKSFLLDLFMQYGTIFPITDASHYILDSASVAITGLNPKRLPPTLQMYLDVEICYNVEEDCKTIRLTWPLKFDSESPLFMKTSWKVSLDMDEIIETIRKTCAKCNMFMLLAAIRFENTNKKGLLTENFLQFMIHLSILQESNVSTEENTLSLPTTTYSTHPIVMKTTEPEKKAVAVKPPKVAEIQPDPFVDTAPVNNRRRKTATTTVVPPPSIFDIHFNENGGGGNPFSRRPFL